MYSREFRAAAIQEARRTNVAVAARRFHIARNTLSAWVKADSPWWRLPKHPEPESIFDEEEEL